MNKEEMLLKGKINKTLFKISMPLIISQLISVLYNIVDRIFIGKIPEIGLTALSGVGIAFPIIIIVIAFAGLLGLGGGPIASIKLGENKKAEASIIASTSFVSLIVVGVIITAVLLIFNEEFLLLFGATYSNLIYASRYLKIYSLGTVFVLIAVGLNIYITCEGQTKVAMISVLIGTILNIILDPILFLV